MSLISVITINYNNVAGLASTINSVLEQEGAQFEFIIIDGGSTDGSAELIKKHADKLAYSVSEKDSGIYNAQNKGLLRAKNEYCLFLNSGDVLVDKQVLKNVISKGLNSDIVYGDIITIDSTKNKIQLNSPEHLDAYQFMISTLWHPSAFIKRELFAKFGLYNETFKIAGDYEFFIRSVLKNGASTKHITLPIAIFDLGGVSNTQNNNTVQLQERKEAWKLNFSDIVIKAFEQRTQIVRSREYKLGKLFMKVFSPFVR